MIEVFAKILTAQKGTVLGDTLWLTTISTVLFFAPYAILRLIASERGQNRIDLGYDFLMVILFMGLFYVSIDGGGFLGAVAWAIGVGIGVGVYCIPLLLVLALSACVRCFQDWRWSTAG